MHVEKNISASVLGYVLGDRDTVAVRKDMQSISIRERLHLQPRGRRGNYLKPHAPYSLRPEESKQFLRTIGSIQTPTGYSSGMSRRVGEKRLQGLKTHDHHVLLQDILPACIRGFLHPGARDAIIRLGYCYKRMCTKAVNPTEIGPLQQFVAETMCLLEIWFQPAFFDIMPHLTLHLVDELDWLGPVHSRWCYGVERYLYVLKQYVRNRSKPEASIATGYLYSEALGFLSEHLKLYPGHKRIWTSDEDERNCGEVLEGRETRRVLEECELKAVHEFIISNYAATSPLYE